MSAIPQPASWQAGFLSMLPAIQTHATIKFRKMPLERREDAVQEAIARACVAYQLLAAQGKLHAAYPGPLADYAVRQIRAGRHVGGRQDAAKDPLSSACQRRHGVKVVNYDASATSGVNAWKNSVIPDRKADVPSLACFRVDFAEWLKRWRRRDRRIIVALASGMRTDAVAGRFGVSPGRISQLRRKYEDDWRAFQKDAA